MIAQRGKLSWARSETMPVTPGSLQPKYAGDNPHLGHGGVYGGDCYLARLSPDGSRVLAATYFGGSKQERNAYGMALDISDERHTRVGRQARFLLH